MENQSIYPSQFHKLPVTGQIFIWSIRHLVYAKRMDQDLCPHVGMTFQAAGLNNAVPIIENLLQSISDAAISSVSFNFPDGSELVSDEQCLAAYLNNKLTRPERCACHFLKNMLKPSSMGLVVSHFNSVARLMSQFSRPKQKQPVINHASKANPPTPATNKTYTLH